MSEWHWVSINPVWAVCVCVCARPTPSVPWDWSWLTVPKLSPDIDSGTYTLTIDTSTRSIHHIQKHTRRNSEFHAESNDFSFTLKALLFRSLPFCYTWNWICFQEVFPYRTLYQDTFRPVKASMISLAAPCIQATASLLFFGLQCWMISGYERWTGF